MVVGVRVAGVRGRLGVWLLVHGLVSSMTGREYGIGVPTLVRAKTDHEQCIRCGMLCAEWSLLGQDVCASCLRRIRDAIKVLVP